MSQEAADETTPAGKASEKADIKNKAKKLPRRNRAFDHGVVAVILIISVLVSVVFYGISKKEQVEEGGAPGFREDKAREKTEWFRPAVYEF